MTAHHAHRISPGTHTVEMAQIIELNRRLGEVGEVTAAVLGLDGARSRSGVALPSAAALSRVCWEGAPTFPEIQAVFTDRAGSGTHLVVDLHTTALHELSRCLGLHQAWGVGPRQQRS